MPDNLGVNFTQIEAASQAWTDIGDEADRVAKNLTDGVPDLMTAFGNDVYARKAVPNLQPALDGSVTLITSVKGQSYSTAKNLAITGQQFAKADGVNKDLVPPGTDVPPPPAYTPPKDAPPAYTPPTDAPPAYTPKPAG